MQIVISLKEGICPSPKDMAKQILSYMEFNSYLIA